MFMRLTTALAIVCAAQPALGASLEGGQARAGVGVAGRAYIRLPFGRRGDATPHFGIASAVSRQDYDPGGMPISARRDAEAFGVRVGFDGRSSLTLAGTPLRDAERRNARGDGGHRSPWGTIAIVAGGLVLVAGAAYAHVLHLADKHSD